MANIDGHTCTIGGVKVHFPCKPYPSQFSMMDKIIKGLQKKQNCLLESPTGSGKSLALLCSALAWQQAEHEKARQEEEDIKIKDKECCCQTGSNDSPYFPSAGNAQPAQPSLTPDVSMGLAANISAVGDEDDDFKTSTKKFRLSTGYGSGRAHVQVGYEETEPGDQNPAWRMEVNPTSEAHPPYEARPSCKSCSCDEDQYKSKPPRRKVPKIYFGTRTHKQIAQIARELGKTKYKYVKMCILSSREHTCIDPEVSTCNKKNEECKNKLDGPGCRFFDQVRRITHRSVKNHMPSAWDLEDFVSHCKKFRACPYYGSRGLKEGADIIFCPYNYLVDPVVRKSMEICLKDQIVILDEAHNIEDSAREAASFSVLQKQLSDSTEDINKMVEFGLKVAEHLAMKGLCESLNQLMEMHQNSLEEGGNFNEARKIWTGLEMVAQLENCNIGPQQFPDLLKCFAVVSTIEEDDEKKDKSRKLQSSTYQVLEGIFMVLDYIYRENMRFLGDFRVAVVRSVTYGNMDTNNMWLNKKGRRHQPILPTFKLHFWCMNPAVAFSDIGGVVRSVVVTSGTLSPMTSFQSELGAPFPIQLEAPHVVSRSQVWVGTVSKGPRGGQLLGSYQTAETYTYQDELGNLVLNVCKTIPHGVLCFLPSYKMLDKLKTRWIDIGLWETLSQYKVIMTEPRGGDKVDFDTLMKNFYDAIKESQENNGNEGEEGERRVTGALFIAVCRGKVSEGLDFADDNARAVIAVSIPYPNIKDTQVELKRQYNNQHQSRGLLSGSAWYEIQAYRAINQALGRCIRHRNDWGALILVDERYAKNPNKYIKGLSKWVRNNVQYYTTFQQAQMSLGNFTKSMLERNISENSTFNASMSTIKFNVSSMAASSTTSTAHPHPVSPSQEAIPRLAMSTSQAGGFLPSQAGGFLPDSQLATQEPTQLKSHQETVLQGSKHQDDTTNLHDGSMLMEMEFNPPLTSTQRTPKTPVSDQRVQRGHGQLSSPSGVEDKRLTNAFHKLMPPPKRSSKQETPSRKLSRLAAEHKAVTPIAGRNSSDTKTSEVIPPQTTKTSPVVEGCDTPNKGNRTFFKFVKLEGEPSVGSTILNSDRTVSPPLFDSEPVDSDPMDMSHVDATVKEIQGAKAIEHPSGQTSPQPIEDRVKPLRKPLFKTKSSEIVEEDENKHVHDETPRNINNETSVLTQKNIRNRLSRSLSRIRNKEAKNGTSNGALADISLGADDIFNTSKVQNVTLSKENASAGEENVNEEDTLNTKRGKRRRVVSKGGGGGRKKQKGVVYDDEEEAEEDVQEKECPSCRMCGKILTVPGAELATESHVPDFFKHIAQLKGRLSHGCLVTKCEAITNTCKAKLPANTEMYVNSYLSVEDGCCVQYHWCEGCLDTDSQHILPVVPPVAAHVIAVSKPGRCRVGQVWFLASMVS